MKTAFLEDVPLPHRRNHRVRQIRKYTTPQPKVSISPTLYEIFFDEARVHLATLQRELQVLEGEELSPTRMRCTVQQYSGRYLGDCRIKSTNQLGMALEHALMRRDGAAHLGGRESLSVLRQAVDALNNRSQLSPRSRSQKSVPS